MSRLNTIAPDVANRIANSSREELSAIRLRLANWVESMVSGIDEQIDNVFVLLREGATVPESIVGTVQSCSEQYDELAWDATDAGDADYLRLFAIARATSAVVYLSRKLSAASISEAAYEAQAATGDIATVTAIVMDGA